jgi:hypothetical protein
MRDEKTRQLAGRLTDLLERMGKDRFLRALNKSVHTGAIDKFVWSKDKSKLVINGKLVIDLDYQSVYPLDEWFVNEREDSLIQDFAEYDTFDFNKKFWERPDYLYHSTDEENVESITANGLNKESRTRGISNRSVGSAVYTTLNLDMANAGHYGNSVFEIDTVSMKKDGLTPQVELEPDVQEKVVREIIAHKLGMEDYQYDVEQGMDEDTVVVFGAIPPKYLKLL